jgi:hypothetical protein
MKRERKETDLGLTRICNCLDLRMQDGLSEGNRDLLLPKRCGSRRASNGLKPRSRKRPVVCHPPATNIHPTLLYASRQDPPYSSIAPSFPNVPEAHPPAQPRLKDLAI